MVETVAAMAGLVDDGLIRYVGLSNYTLTRLQEWSALTLRDRRAAPLALQPLYNLMERDAEADVLPFCQTEGIPLFPYSALAGGFLTGKYRADGAAVDSRRGSGTSQYPRRARAECPGSARRHQ